jgi:RNA polymerase sigma factor (sigma-70 family)
MPVPQKKYQETFESSVLSLQLPIMSSLPPESSTHWVIVALARFERPLVRFAQNLCGDWEQARDAVQETFLRLSKSGKPPKDGDVEHLAAWLFTTCRHRIIDWQRKNKRLTTMDTLTLEALPETSHAPDSALEAKDTASHLRDLVAHLPAQQREVIQLKFEAGLSYKEIAAATGISIGTVGWLIHTAVQALRTSWMATQS